MGSLEADSQPGSSEGRRPLGAVPYSSYEPGELSQWLCYDDSTINILIVIIIIVIHLENGHKTILCVCVTCR